jgi:hypothetical protein
MEGADGVMGRNQFSSYGVDGKLSQGLERRAIGGQAFYFCFHEGPTSFCP